MATQRMQYPHPSGLSYPPTPCQIGLAPMEGVSDFAFRLWVRLCSQPDFTSTPFLRATDTYPARVPAEVAPELEGDRQSRLGYRLIPQIMASKPLNFIRVASAFLSKTDFVDLNCGCPASNSVGSGAGSSLLKEPETFRSFIDTACRALGPGRVSVKMRTGFSSHAEFETLLNCLQNQPIARLGIHGRHRIQRYSGMADWQLIQRAALELNVPVVGSGDILSQPSLMQRLQFWGPEKQKLEAVIIGRGAIRNPWIFS